VHITVILFLLLYTAAVPVPSWANNNFIIGGNITKEIDPATGFFKNVSKWEIRTSGGTLVSSGSTDRPRNQHCTVKLANGNVFVAGGTDVAPDEPQPRTSIAVTWEIRNSVGALVSKGANLNSPRVGSTCHRLGNGNVMLIGGSGLGATTLEIHSQTGALVATRNLWTSRLTHTSTLLANGNVMIVGGTGSSGTWETYDGNGNLVASTGTTGIYLWSGRYNHCAVLLSTGNVFLGGGDAGPMNWEIRTSSGTLVTANYVFDTRGNGHSCSILAGNVFIAGGSSVPTSWETRNTSGALVATARNLLGWSYHTATVQTDTGNILLAYGTAWELRNSSGGAVSSGSLLFNHSGHTTTEL